jgi:GNAT superfamily N-acetyltransferase
MAEIDAINRIAWHGSITTHELLEARHGPICGQSWTERIIRAAAKHLARPDVSTFVAEADGRVVGYAAAQIEDGDGGSDIGIVSYNAVLPEHRGRGIGTALIRRVSRHLREMGARVLVVWTLESDAPAMAVYGKLGFAELTRFIYYTLEPSADDSE